MLLSGKGAFTSASNRKGSSKRAWSWGFLWSLKQELKSVEPWAHQKCVHLPQSPYIFSTLKVMSTYAWLQCSGSHNTKRASGSVRGFTLSSKESYESCSGSFCLFCFILKTFGGDWEIKTNYKRYINLTIFPLPYTSCSFSIREKFKEKQSLDPSQLHREACSQLWNSLPGCQLIHLGMCCASGSHFLVTHFESFKIIFFFFLNMQTPKDSGKHWRKPIRFHGPWG